MLDTRDQFELDRPFNRGDECLWPDMAHGQSEQFRPKKRLESVKLGHNAEARPDAQGKAFAVFVARRVTTPGPAQRRASRSVQFVLPR